jgi:hypothetical protein
MRIILLLATVLAIIAPGLEGCGDHKAKQRVLEAVNPSQAVVEDGQAAVLQLKNGYLVMLPKRIRSDEVHYKVFFSSSGKFGVDEKSVMEGVAKGTTPVEVEGCKVVLSYGGEKSTVVILDFGDTKTGLALFPTNDLRSLDASKLTFKQTKQINRDDFERSVGIN